MVESYFIVSALLNPSAVPAPIFVIDTNLFVDVTPNLKLQRAKYLW